MKKRTRAIRNNFYAMKLLWKICPSQVIHRAVTQILGYFEWLFYSAFFMRYVINALETEQEFSAIHMIPGDMVVFFPEDGHAPCLEWNGTSHVKKLIAKVLL